MPTFFSFGIEPCLIFNLSILQYVAGDGFRLLILTISAVMLSFLVLSHVPYLASLAQSLTFEYLTGHGMGFLSLLL